MFDLAYLKTLKDIDVTLSGYSLWHLSYLDINTNCITPILKVVAQL